MRTPSCRISDRPKVATIESAATLWMGWMTIRWISAPMAKPISGATMNASQKLPVVCSVAQASTVPTMKKSPCARLMMSSRPKMMARPSAISAMIRPQISPFMARSRSLSIGLVVLSGVVGGTQRRRCAALSQCGECAARMQYRTPWCVHAKSCPGSCPGRLHALHKHHAVSMRGSNAIICLSRRNSSGESPSARPTSCGRCRIGMSSFSPMSFSISCWKLSSTV